MGMLRMLQATKRSGPPSIASDAEKIALVRSCRMGTKVKDLAAKHNVSCKTIWHWLRQGRELIRASGQEF